jgi:DNA polymerase-3 subunit gamma/tau
MPVATLYRQYRPQTFKELFGQDPVRATLMRAVESNKLTHAYLFFGPRGTGKTTTARLLAKRVNCLAPDGAEPCGQCASCEALQSGRHIDVIEIDAASNRGIDDIRTLREATAFVPTLGAYKVYIIDEVHMLTKEAASALLKTLEEPVPHVMFILATTELHKVLPTVASRCQVYRFRRASTEELRSRLTFLLAQEKREAEAEAIDFIIDRADGCFRDAESLLGQMLTLQEGKIMRSDMASFLGLPSPELLTSFLTAVVSGKARPALEAVDELFAAGVDPEHFLRDAIRSARDEAVRLASGETPTWSSGAAGAAARLPQIIRALLQAVQDLAYVPQPLIAVHLAILTVCIDGGGAAPKTSPPATTSKTPVQRRAGVASVKAIADAWPRLIAQVQKTNPVAATFLRAVHPIAVDGTRVTIQAQFSLHRTFFERPEVSKLVTETLSTLLAQPVTLAFVLNEGEGRPSPSLAEARQRHEEKFQETVKEVFGAA